VYLCAYISSLTFHHEHARNIKIERSRIPKVRWVVLISENVNKTLIFCTVWTWFCSAVSVEHVNIFYHWINKSAKGRVTLITLCVLKDHVESIFNAKYNFKFQFSPLIIYLLIICISFDVCIFTYQMFRPVNKFVSAFHASFRDSFFN
jgi:hypothetical protein